MLEGKKTILFDEHVANNGQIVEFGGYLMPLQYTSIASEHQAVRENVGLFDVSHMGEILIQGKDATKFVNYLITNDVNINGNMKMTYGLMCYINGGVVDDLMAYKITDEEILLVVNASNKDKDYEWITSNIGEYDVIINDQSSYYSQLALQGPNAINVIKKIGTDLSYLKFFEFDFVQIINKKFIVSRSGYTGEDGFEIYGANEDIKELFKVLVYQEKVTLCGLGCRDTLRFEAAMPLYGHEIDFNITPYEAALSHAVKTEKNFIGRNSLLKEKEEGSKRKLVGLVLLEKGIARNGYEVFHNDQVIGYITTGYMIPNTQTAYACALIDVKYSQIGTEVYVQIRKNKVKALVRNRKFLIKKYVK